MIQNVSSSASLYKAQSKQNITFGKKKQKSMNNKRSTNHVTPSKIMMGLAVLGTLYGTPALQSCSSKDDIKPEIPVQVDSTDTDEIKYDIITPTEEIYYFTPDICDKLGENIKIENPECTKGYAIQAATVTPKNIYLENTNGIDFVAIDKTLGTSTYLKGFEKLDKSSILYDGLNREDFRENPEVVTVKGEKYIKVLNDGPVRIDDEGNYCETGGTLYPETNVFVKIGDENTSKEELDKNYDNVMNTVLEE